MSRIYNGLCEGKAEFETAFQFFFGHISLSRARPATAAPPLHFRIGTLRSGVSVISDPPTFVLIGLGLALVAMFAVGFYWLATKDRPTRPHSPVAPPLAPGAALPRAVAVDEFEEWEAFAPYPDHVAHTAHEASVESSDSYPPLGRREEPAYASSATEARHDLHDAIESLMGEPSKPDPAPTKAAAPTSSGSSAARVVCPRVSTRAIAPARPAARSADRLRLRPYIRTVQEASETPLSLMESADRTLFTTSRSKRLWEGRVFRSRSNLSCHHVTIAQATSWESLDRTRSDYAAAADGA
ncbi:hypothetical protein [Burkholderia sp. ABCPW 11]|uniref:hypothetical protein n=1 Tax=Burkholderia sp. ABCPW 11 TaxID=1637859 RepID=UPI0015D0CD81|nr:hypothetical protein [Burkholderia sp. ABCPW 11]